MARFYLGRMQLKNYAQGEWIKGTGKQSDLVGAINGALIASFT